MDLDHVEKLFRYGHLPPLYQMASKPFYEVAVAVVNMLPPSAERTLSLRSLWEAKNLAVFATALATEPTLKGADLPRVKPIVVVDHDVLDLNQANAELLAENEQLRKALDGGRDSQEALRISLAGKQVRTILAEALGLDPDVHGADDLARLAADAIKASRGVR